MAVHRPLNVATRALGPQSKTNASIPNTFHKISYQEKKLFDFDNIKIIIPKTVRSQESNRKTFNFELSHLTFNSVSTILLQNFMTASLVSNSKGD